MRVVYRPSADADLLDLFVSIAGDNPAAAERFIERLRKALRRLADFPDSAPARPEIGAGIRGLSVPPYIAYYAIMDAEVAILRIIHAAREQPSLGEDLPA